MFLNKRHIIFLVCVVLSVFGTSAQGYRLYELTNHLGNAQTVINAHVFPLSSDSETIDGYQVSIQSIYDYSPYGVLLDGRTIERDPPKEKVCYTVLTGGDTTYLVNFGATTSSWYVHQEGASVPSSPNLSVSNTLNLVSVNSLTLPIYDLNGGVTYISYDPINYYDLKLNLLTRR
jgi:hypothetical protein